MIEKQIAVKMRALRKAAGLTLEQLGKKIGISRGMLSRLENNQSSPPIATLAKIAQGLEVPISIFFEEDSSSDEKKYAVTRNNLRKQVVRHGCRIGFTYYAFSKIKDLHLIEAFIVKHPPVKKKIKLLFDHPGEEFVLVLKGAVEWVYGRETLLLKAGDAVHFDPSIPHRIQNVGQEKTECLVIIAGEKGFTKRG
jgi:transcriptional regulator with XRE-family HTH domain